MRIPPNFRKSITWVYLAILLGLFIGWVSSYPKNKWQWIILGAIVGFVFEVVSNLYRRKRKKLSNIIEAIILVGCVFLDFFSRFVPQMLGLALGIILAVTVFQVCFQLYKRKVISWEEVSEVP